LRCVKDVCDGVRTRVNVVEVEGILTVIKTSTTISKDALIDTDCLCRPFIKIQHSLVANRKRSHLNLCSPRFIRAASTRQWSFEAVNIMLVT